MTNIEAVGGTGEPPSAKALAEKETLASAYTCEIDAQPEWCVSAETLGGGEERVLHWIRPSLEAEFVAMRMARLATELGTRATAKKTKWHQG